MDWTTQLQLLHLMQGSFPGPNLLELPSQRVPGDQVRALLEQTELGQREEVDAAVRAFSRSGKWPENLSRSEKYFLTQRLEFAVWLTLALVAPDGSGRHGIVPNPPPEFDKEEQVEWLLIWAWRVPGVKYWLEKCVLNERLDQRQP